MTFLQPYILWGLALISVPIIIHLLNRMRYRSLDWAAMSFLLAASRRSRRQAKLRHWLVLLCRALAIGALVLAMARPLVGGWLGFAMSGAPETVILLFDRSPSMELQDAQSRESKRVVALQRVTEAARALGGASRLVLIDSATRVPQEISNATVLPELSVTGAADAGADLPGMLEAAVEYIAANQSGRTEIWIASDLQASNWQPDSSRWADVTTRIGALPQDVRVRLLALRDGGAENLAVRVTEVKRLRGQVLLTIELDSRARKGAPTSTIPLSIAVEGARSLVNVPVSGTQVRLQQKVDLGERKTGGWGAVELPPDANGRDNVSHFAFGAETHLKSVVVSDDAAVGKVLRLAAAPAPAVLNQSSALMKLSEVARADWRDVALVIWQSKEDPVKALTGFLESRGVVVSFPTEKSGESEGWRVTSWNRGDGLLADAQDGVELPVAELSVKRRAELPADGTVLASFEDGKAFLTRQTVGKGKLYACATLPAKEWSNLAEGTVLIPVLQRALQEGGQRLGQAMNAAVGEALGFGVNEIWQPVGEKKISPASDAGVYQVGGRTVALNRPVTEDARETVDEATVKKIFGSVPVRFFEEKADASAKLSSEIWRWFVAAVLLFLIGEAVLTLPGEQRQTAESAA